MSGVTFDFVYSGTDKERLDRYLVGQLPDQSRSRLQALIKDGKQWCGARWSPSPVPVGAGDDIRIAIPEPEPTDLVPEKIPDIVYEDERLMVVNKPAGWWCIRLPGMTPARWSTRRWPMRLRWKESGRAPAGDCPPPDRTHPA